MFQGKRTYGEFLSSEEKIATNYRCSNAQDLLAVKMMRKKKSRIIYSLTDKGIDLVPVMLELAWSAKHDKQTGAPKDFVARIKKDKENFVKEIVSNLKKLHSR